VGITDFFCPVCGKNIKEKPIATGTLVQIGLYLVSVLLPPLFIGWTIRYLKSKDPTAKQIGMISLGLTIVSLTVAIWLTIAFVKNITKGVNQQLNQYQNSGLY
jgi:hypothetical protein